MHCKVTHSRMESQQGMFKPRQRLKKLFLFISFDPRGNGDCFYTAAAHQLSLEREQVKKLVFQHLENHQIDVSLRKACTPLSKKIRYSYIYEQR